MCGWADWIEGWWIRDYNAPFTRTIQIPREIGWTDLSQLEFGWTWDQYDLTKFEFGWTQDQFNPIRIWMDTGSIWAQFEFVWTNLIQLQCLDKTVQPFAKFAVGKVCIFAKLRKYTDVRPVAKFYGRWNLNDSDQCWSYRNNNFIRIIYVTRWIIQQSFLIWI